ncbi:secondary thiamine-phosphate synthase enzyme YjbQ [Candidatus Methylomirabilis sp.]|uniref:secondary thiamine-phosphate synthase enzyme YjbQ n=1 Tax=Candidatus Methylomirabilis sp. TaxID=2032687 RepID=UPI002A5ED842|nr:secondary thiamine-phosphate synthase enzyme YjbQ [Candidatus Methylomirabilis sp.]
MVIRHETFTVATEDRLQFMDLTKRVRDLLQRYEIKQGLVILNSLHTTTALFINEWQEALLHDIQILLDRLVNKQDGYRHNDPCYSDCDRSNADSHLRSLLLGRQLVVPMVDGEMSLGTFESIIFAELDGPRERQIQLQILAE